MGLLLKISRRGASTLLPLLIGLLIALAVFRKKRNFSQMEYDLLIQETLRAEGYTPSAARIVAAIARHESGNYSSPLFVNHKNFFGMRVARKRPHAQDYETIPSDPARSYAGFVHPVNSIRDLVLYHSYVGIPRSFDTVDKIVSLMKSKGYFEDSIENYLNGVKRALPKVAEL